MLNEPTFPPESEREDRVSRHHWARVAAAVLLNVLDTPTLLAIVAGGELQFRLTAQRYFVGHAFRQDDLGRIFGVLHARAQQIALLN